MKVEFYTVTGCTGASCQDCWSLSNEFLELIKVIDKQPNVEYAFRHLACEDVWDDPGMQGDAPFFVVDGDMLLRGDACTLEAMKAELRRRGEKL